MRFYWGKNSVILNLGLSRTGCLLAVDNCVQLLLLTSSFGLERLLKRRLLFHLLRLYGSIARGELIGVGGRIVENKIKIK